MNKDCQADWGSKLRLQVDGRLVGACIQRFGALRCGGFLALRFIRSTNDEPCTKVSTKNVSPHNAKPLLAAAVLSSVNKFSVILVAVPFVNICLKTFAVFRHRHIVEVN
jgi:hypothetical protein